MRVRRLLLLALALALLAQSLASVFPINSVRAQSSVDALMAEMTPAEKVGQLFLITFDGRTIPSDGPLAQLIQDYHIGGVVLSSSHNNFSGTDTASSTRALIETLQQLAWQKSQAITDPTTPQPEDQDLPAYIPLYIGISQKDDTGKQDQFLQDLTQLPNPMAIGATWSEDNATQVGQALGRELAALGFNLYLGPSLDVVDTSDLLQAANAGTETFGGDPYWVGLLAKAYIAGLHSGSEGQMSVIARHFPGLGGADRPPLEEVSTIQKSLEQLKQIELSPFMAVAGAEDPLQQADGFMVSHIRFQGLQGNIRATTKPVSFDQAALAQLLSVEPITAWRQAGGLTVSDSLGSRAVRLFFDPTGNEFDPINIARTAFLAGNDVLYLDNFWAKSDLDPFTTIRRTMDSFTAKYEEDSVFAQQVDASVRRILEAKLKRYPEFNLEIVSPPVEELENLGMSESVSLKTAREGASLIAPSQEFLAGLLPQPPSYSEYITVFTDTRTLQQCSTCESLSHFSTYEFFAALTELYGSRGSRQLSDSRISSYSFVQLTEILDQISEPSDPYMIDNLRRSKWIIFNFQGLDSSLPQTYALKRLLAERVDLLQNKNVIVFSYGEPYYLDSTEIAKLTAYYALYDKTQAALDIAARVLMQEAQPVGSLPVSLNTVGYDLAQQTAPHPNQVIPIALLTSSPITAELTPTPEAPVSEPVTPVPLFRMGETVRIQAGPVLDKNGHSVPDGTVVRFTVRLAGEDLIIAQPDALTADGLATINYRIERDGILEVNAASQPAMVSGTLVLNTQGGLAQVIMPTPTPTIQPTLTITPLPTQTPVPSPTPEPGANTTGFPRMMDWFLIVLILIAGFGVAYLVGFRWWGGPIWAFRSGFCTLIGGLLAYLLLTLGIESLVELVKQSSSWFIVQMTIVGMLFGWVIALIWWLKAEGMKP
ncbi:MAG TPA: glycoside hydrolase family 3 N-terminal domain-containing protein, partial [Anaerolineaceae bacterium]|nr:glycoside hydrolase family 3 N-terminal domain-containing protein [Anaerolineaceae bacterium]